MLPEDARAGTWMWVPVPASAASQPAWRCCQAQGEAEGEAQGSPESSPHVPQPGACSTWPLPGFLGENSPSR